MKLLLLSDSNSPHTIRWAKSLNMLGHEVVIFSLHEPNVSLYNDSPEIKIISLNASRDLQTKSESTLSKLIYLKAIKLVKKIIRDYKPNILHAHYASSYGFIGSFAAFHPFIISLWGGDVFSFPNRSILHNLILKISLSSSDKILSTSKVMREEAKKYTNKEIIVTPFGIDTDRFSPKTVNKLFEKNDLVIGTIKTLEKHYGVEYLILAFSELKKILPSSKIKLLIVGQGTQRRNLEELVSKLNLQEDTKFTGFVDHFSVQDFHNMLDIYVAMSLEESFGVAVLESSSCANPVVVSNVGGFPEVVDNGITGFIVESKNYNELANKLSQLVLDADLRTTMGNNGRKKVIDEYSWDVCVDQMVAIYKSVLT